MGFIAYLKLGSKTIDLTTDPYHLDPGWAPPAPNSDALMSTGNMASPYAGGRLIDTKYNDRVMQLPLNIKGGSAAETHQALSRLASFLRRGIEDKSEKLYLVYNPSDAISYEPKWGQHHRYYEIKNADTALRRISDYLRANVRNAVIFATLPLSVAPLTTGLRQRVGSATGGITEHTWATEDGLSRGLVIPEAVTKNFFNNPIFGHGTWNNNWTNAANIVDVENTDKEFILFGSSSAKLTSVGATNKTYTQSLTADNTNPHYLSGFVKLVDGGVVSATHCGCYYGSAKTTTYTPVGDGWYRISAAVTGVAGATDSGLYVNENYTLYTDGWQLEEKAYATPFFYGDLLDCAWAGTAHASVSSRTAARWRTDASVINIAAGTIRVVWIADKANTAWTGNRRIFQDNNGNLTAWYAGATTDFRFGDGTNSIDSGAETFSNGDVIVLHYVFEPGSLKIYRDGAQIATGSTYDPPTAPTLIYLGTTNASGEHTNGTYADFTIWDRACTATEILNDYTDISAHVTGGDGYGQVLNPIPWLWTDDGDNVIDYYYDATHENFAISGGIPGNLPAHVKMYLYGQGGEDILLSRYGYKYFYSPANLFADQSGTVVASTVGGEMHRTSLSTTGETLLATNISILEDDLISGKQFHIYTSVQDAGSGLKMAAAVDYSGVYAIVSDYDNFSADSTRRNFLVGPYQFFDYADLRNDQSPSVTLYGKRTSGTANVDVDFIVILLGEYTVISPSDSNSSRFTVEGLTFIGDLAGSVNERGTIRGKEFTLEPNVINHIIGESGPLDGATDITNAIEFNQVFITPRWSIV